MGGKERSRLKHLLALLGARGFAGGYDYSDVDGVHGWLYEPETAELVELLRVIDLPRFPASFAAMEGFQVGERGRYQPPDDLHLRYEPQAQSRFSALAHQARSWSVTW